MVASVHLHLGIKSVWSSKLNIRHKLIYITLINGIDSIWHLFAIPRCTYALINYNWLTLRYNWHKVYCRGKSILFSTNISVFSYCNQRCCQYFLSLISEIKWLMCVVLVAESCLLSSDKKEWKNAWRWIDGVIELIYFYGNALKISDSIPYIDTYIVPP